jgi:hypothetical protein
MKASGRSEMMETGKANPGTQRLFQHPNGGYVLLSKFGQAVSFWFDPKEQLQVKERFEDVDFKATGSQLKQEGWRCVGPGLEFSWLLEK